MRFFKFTLWTLFLFRFGYQLCLHLNSCALNLEPFCLLYLFLILFPLKYKQGGSFSSYKNTTLLNLSSYAAQNQLGIELMLELMELYFWEIDFNPKSDVSFQLITICLGITYPSLVTSPDVLYQSDTLENSSCNFPNQTFFSFYLSKINLKRQKYFTLGDTLSQTFWSYIDIGLFSFYQPFHWVSRIDNFLFLTFDYSFCISSRNQEKAP